MLESLQNEELEYQKLTPEEQQRRGILGRLIGICADFIDPTRNGRHYSEQLWEKTFEDPIMVERIENGVCYGELGHPADREETDMEKIAICLPEVPKKGKDGKLRAVFDILNTPNGRILKTLCEYGSTLGISSRGSGDTYPGSDGNEEVDPDSYTCQGFDVVLIPAVKSARLQYVTESLNHTKSLKESLEEMVKGASEEDKKVMEETLDNLHLNESAESDLKDAVRETIEYIKDAFPIEPEHWYGFNSWDEVLENLDYNPADLIETADGLITELDRSIKATERIVKHSKLDPKVDFVLTDDPDYEIEKDLRSELRTAYNKYAKELYPDMDDSYLRETIEKDLTESKRNTDNMNLVETDYDDSGKPWAEVKKELKKKFENKGYTDVIVERVKSDTKGLKMYSVYGNKLDESQLDEEKEILYVIKDKHGNQLSRPTADDSELWDRVESRDPDGRKGLRVVAYTGTSESLEDSTSSFDIQDEPEEEPVVDDEDSLVEELQDVLKKNKELEQSVLSLNEKLSVCYAKETKYTERIDTLRESVLKLTESANKGKALSVRAEKLQEQLNKKDNIISEKNRKIQTLAEEVNKNVSARKALNEEARNSMRSNNALKEELNTYKDEIRKLTEAVEDLKKDIQLKKSNYSKKLEESNKLVEKYKNVTKNVVDRYIASQARRLGASVNEIKNRLPESYSLDDIDKVCEDFRDYKLNISKLPFSAMKLNEDITFKAKPSTNDLIPENINEDDEVDEQLMSLLKRD